MQLIFIQSLIKKYIENGFDKTIATNEIGFVIEILTGINSVDLNLGQTFDIKDETKIVQIIEERIKTGKPIQQLVGETFFMRDRFFVNEFTLIPRHETELVILECLRLIKDIKIPKILDIGSGSGCISIEIAKFLKNCQIISTDICDEALKIAAKNAKKLCTSDKITFLKSDIYENIKDKFDLIVSNPPYIPFCEREIVQKEVRDFEPSIALFAKDMQGIEYFEKIINNAKDFLTPNGFIVFQIGPHQSDIIKKLLTNNAFTEINIINDLNHKIPIVISAQSLY